MNDLRKTIIPKSDQLNADDLIGGPVTVTVTKVALVTGEQPVAVHVEGFEGRPFKPCKSMRRVLIYLWGDNGNAYVGRKMTLYRDHNVKFGGDKVGGIRISHMSDIKQKVEMALTATRGSRKPYTVLPLVMTAATPAPEIDTQSLIDEGNEAAERGTDILKAFWGRLKKAQQEPLMAYIEAWKKRAVDIDMSGVNNLNAG